MPSALRFRRHDERARRLVNRTPQAGSDSNVVGDDTNTGFSLTGPITITVFVPPSTTTSQTPITTSQTTSTTTTPTATITPSASSTRPTTATSTTNQPSISVVPPSGAEDGANEADTTGAVPVGPNGALNSGPVLSTGAIVAIIVSLILVLIIGAVILLRRKNLFARKQRRATWLAKGGIMGPKPIEGYDNFLPISIEKPPPPAPSAPPPALVVPAPYNPTTTSYSNAIPNAPPPPPSSYVQQLPASPIMNEEGTPATVVCTFIPTLPDELNILNGETLRILAEYDDGWGLCVNALQERGMVPLECLDRKGGGAASGSGSVEGREFKRDSSLTGVPAPLAPNRLN